MRACVANRLSLLASVVALLRSVDPSSAFEIYPLVISLTLGDLCGVVLMFEFAVWIVETAKALFRQLKRPLPLYFFHFAYGACSAAPSPHAQHLHQLHLLTAALRRRVRRRR